MLGAIDRLIDEVDGVFAASPARTACRFWTSLQANGEYTDEAKVLRPTALAPLHKGGKCKRYRPHLRNRNVPLAVDSFYSNNPNFAPRQGKAPPEPASVWSKSEEATNHRPCFAWEGRS